MSIDKNSMDLIKDLAIEKGIPRGPKLTVTLDLFDQYLQYIGDGDQPQKVEITRNGVTTVKLTNLRFHLKPLFLATMKLAGEYTAADPSRLTHITLIRVWLILNYLAFVRNLSTIKITDAEAEVVIAVYRLLIEQDQITIENTWDLLSTQLTSEQFDQAMAVLEHLGVLCRNGQEIKIKEEFVKE